MGPPPSPRVIAIAGPTGSGKTTIGIELAERLHTEIISADSMQCYRGMEIGTAAPTEEEQGRVRHHFVGCLDPDEEMAAGQYQHLARDVVEELNKTGKIAVVVGGSGLYLSALLDGLFEGPARRPDIRTRLQDEAAEHGNAALMARLQAVDAEYAALLTSENDLVRIVRALEVYEITGRPFSELHREHRAEAEPLDALQVAPDWDRETLYKRINRRVDLMIEAGWVDEVAELINQGYGPQLERLKALGYREITAHLRGGQSLDEAMEATKQHHRRLAKRQLTWFRGDKRIHWLPIDETTPPAALAEQTLELAACAQENSTTW